MIIGQNGQGYEITGAFKVYGKQEELLKVAQQLRTGALKIEIGWVDIDPNAVMIADTIKPWKE